MLKAFAWLYGKLADFRNTLYDRGVFKSHSLGARTISVGNITTGGTGKTPLVAYVAEILAEAGEKVCILTRGYGRENPRDRVLVSDGESVLVDAKQGGDEPVELARKLIDKALVIADADRVSAAAWAKEKFGITAFVLDDAFQHRRAERDLDIVCIDATHPWGGGRILPAGTLREPFTNLARADAIVVTRADLVESVDEIKERLRKNSHAPIFVSRTEISRLIPLSEFKTNATGETVDSLDWRSLRAGGESRGDSELRVLAFCALGNPDAFFTQLSSAFKDEFDLSAVKTFPDHHFYSQPDITSLERHAQAANVQALLTTAKDAVKLQGLKFEVPCYVVEIEVAINDPVGFRDLVLSA